MEPDFKDALVVTGGGTGGHFFPAVALAEGAKKRWPDRAIVFVGAMRGIECSRLPASGWPHLLLDVEGLHGKSLFGTLRSAWRMYAAVRLLKKIWKRGRPWAVIGTGGYGAGPALLAAKALGIPYFIHESNAEPGMAVRLVANKARRVWLGMEAAEAHLPKARCAYRGTPVRASFLRAYRSCRDLKKPFTLLALGGSGGARAINDALLSIGSALLDAHPDWALLHQTGNLEMERLASAPRHKKHTLVTFIEDPDVAIESASLVLSRAGASTCSELKAAGRPTVFVPLPGSAADHQRRNAVAFATEGRGIVVEQGQGFEVRLFAVLSDLMGDRDRREALSRPEPNTAVQKCLLDMERDVGVGAQRPFAAHGG
jgi:UDP-N-acetylglucosamine--N-acetylmuramyl-(pentapeptide) pyrophosphoryl-undecaprenol N-acetylglucosamine transferase